MTYAPAWTQSNPHIVNTVIRQVISGEKELNNPEEVLELLLNIQGKLDRRGYVYTKPIKFNNKYKS